MIWQALDLAFHFVYTNDEFKGGIKTPSLHVRNENEPCLKLKSEITIVGLVSRAYFYLYPKNKHLQLLPLYIAVNQPQSTTAKERL